MTVSDGLHIHDAVKIGIRIHIRRKVQGLYKGRKKTGEASLYRSYIDTLFCQSICFIVMAARRGDDTIHCHSVEF